MPDILQIPFEFEFRKSKVVWSIATLRLVGWARRPDYTLDGSALKAEISTGGLKYTVKYPRQNLPQEQWDNLWLEAYTDRDVEQKFASWEPSVLVPAGKTYADEASLRKHSQPGDAWDMRNDFFAVKPEVQSAKEFLNKWGRWSFAPFLELRQFVGLQEITRKALTKPAEQWFATEECLPPSGRRTEKYPFFTFLTDKCELAVRLTVTTDLLQQTKFKLCARPDCRNPFPVSGRPEKKYCSSACGHLQVVRRTRKKAHY
jgi:hypothetical protein